ncbi:hypothetical protein HPP92_009088 [Vanilla planifolia]|uniref:rRNA methyltransferase 1, mitochondrial n=1 Tax=Vanilla planifolia TaxID=51239 RepID=A0A835R9Z5_VANPL|nr:hypothetical protein HPP92_009088 [Vanilla planifolia]
MCSHGSISFSRIRATPSFSRVPAEPICLSHGFFFVQDKSCYFSLNLRSRNFSSLCLSRTLPNRCSLKSSDLLTVFCMKSLESSRWFRAAFFSAGAEQYNKYGSVGRETDGRVLPWIASVADKGEKAAKGKRTGFRSTHSTWEESAKKYFSRNGERKAREGKDLDDGRRNLDHVESVDKRLVVEVPEDEDEVDEDELAKTSDDPRWNRIKTKCKGFIDRDSRFQRPEVRHWHNQETRGRRTWQEAAGSSVMKMVSQGVYGVGPVWAALKVRRREFYALYVQEGLDLSESNRKKKDKKVLEKILKVSEKIALKVIEVSKHDLNMAVDNRPHQGLVLDASPLEMVDIKDLDPAVESGQRAPLWVALDEVTDPQNLGAIIRSAYFFGAEGIVLCSKNSAPLSGVVSKASAGSLELIELRSCKNMMKFLTSSMDNGWRVLGGSISQKAVPLYEVEAGIPTILVLGSEGHGLRPLVERSCTQLIRIPGNMSMDRVIGGTETELEGIQNDFGVELQRFVPMESLNVSVAAGVLLYHLVGDASQFAKGLDK